MGVGVGLIALTSLYTFEKQREEARKSRKIAERQAAERREMERRQLTQKDEEIGSAERVRYGRSPEDSSTRVDDLLIPRTKGTSLGVGGGTSKPKTGLGFKV